MRSYPERKWATVTYDKVHSHSDMPGTGAREEGSQSFAFRKLFRYISGANESGSAISMTVPVSTRVTEQAGRTTEEMGFYVPSQHQAAVPAPASESGVAIVTRPEMVAFVRQFGGFARDGDWTQQRDALVQELRQMEDADTIDFDCYYR